MSYGRLNKAIEATGRLSVFRSEAGITNPFGQIDKFQVNMCFPFAQEIFSGVCQISQTLNCFIVDDECCVHYGGHVY